MPKHRPDMFLLVVMLALMAAGLLILASASVFHSQNSSTQAGLILWNQLIKGLLFGGFAGLLAYFIPLAWLKRFALPILIGSFVTMILVFLPGLGWSSGGAARWLKIAGVTWQPAEIFKLAVFIYLAAWLSSLVKVGAKKLGQSKLGSLLPFVVIAAASAILLILQPDVGTLGVILLVAVAMYFAAGTPKWQSLLLLLAGAGAGIALTMLAPYRMQRLLVFLNPDLDPLGASYQLKQGLIAIGSGGLFGRGIGLSQQKLGFLPQGVNDSIFAILAEEAGFLGASLLIILFLLLLWRGMKIAKTNLDQFASLLALGLTCHIFAQTLINIGSILGLIPLTGIPLPLVSYGGSAYLATMIEFGLLLNISRARNL